MSEELKRCPFCDHGSQVALMPSGFRSYEAVECAWCSAEGPPGKTVADAIAAWNTRATPPNPGAPHVEQEQG